MNEQRFKNKIKMKHYSTVLIRVTQIGSIFFFLASDFINLFNIQLLNDTQHVPGPVLGTENIMVRESSDILALLDLGTSQGRQKIEEEKKIITDKTSL